jgi:hypothetical protein
VSGPESAPLLDPELLPLLDPESAPLLDPELLPLPELLAELALVATPLLPEADPLPLLAPELPWVPEFPLEPDPSSLAPASLPLLGPEPALESELLPLALPPPDGPPPLTSSWREPQAHNASTSTTHPP